MGQRGQRIDAREQRLRLVVVNVEHLDAHFHIGIKVAAQMAVDQFQLALKQLVRQQAAGEAGLRVQRLPGGLLVGKMELSPDHARRRELGAKWCQFKCQFIFPPTN
jgi:hypothetical protein